MDEDIRGLGIGGRLRVAGYREGEGGYCNQSGIRYDKQLRPDKSLKIYPVTGQGSPVKVAFPESIDEKNQ
ncbi:MAG: hypothetical protein GTO45_20425 [Candidatus Aminicenantes bacterium]|nr:hypothetical protein [Candidatus Aminicenantes bacterium]NIN44308.1 hypothetical protein [Candidatus Aminicenantes bacterium]NIN87127.1 hypothetical protein [Candidatus Aminicenantes bacterium]NIO83397.1 hypothetical protein [Candidatus Aminicenantes bacterium]NIQ69327.1 hypothetical protein [Candidatus Aminicenantes bacterium]